MPPPPSPCSSAVLQLSAFSAADTLIGSVTARGCAIQPVELALLACPGWAGDMGCAVPACSPAQD